MTDEDITKAFENLTPEDLIKETSAIEVDREADTLGWTFTAFVADEQDRAVMAFKQMEFPDAGDWFVAPAALESTTERREFDPEPDETTNGYLQRLHREAGEMNARRFTLSMLTSAAYTPPEGNLPDVNPLSGDSIRAAVARGELTRHLVVYTAQRDARPVMVMYLVAEDTGKLGAMQAGAPRATLFARVLGDTL